MNDNETQASYSPGPATTALVELDAAMVEALDTFIASQPDPRPSRSRAIRLLLRDGLIGMGLLAWSEGAEGGP